VTSISKVIEKIEKELEEEKATILADIEERRRKIVKMAKFGDSSGGGRREKTKRGDVDRKDEPEGRNTSKRLEHAKSTRVARVTGIQISEDDGDQDCDMEEDRYLDLVNGEGKKKRRKGEEEARGRSDRGHPSYESRSGGHEQHGGKENLENRAGTKKSVSTYAASSTLARKHYR